MTDPRPDARPARHREHRSIAALGLDLQEGQGRPAQAGRLVGVLGLGDAAVQLGDPDVRLRGALPGRRRLPARRSAALGRRRPAQGARSPSCRAGTAGRHALAGVLILLLAPVLGQRADATGRKKRSLFLFTMLLALLQFGLFFVQADPSYFWLGAAFLALGAVVSEIAGVNYNAMLHQVSTRRTIGKVAGSAGASATSAASSRWSSSSCSRSPTGSASTPRTGSPTGSSRSAPRSGRRVQHPDLPQRARGARRSTPSTAR